MKKSVAWLATVVLFVPAIARAQEFAADGIAHNIRGQTARNKIYVEREHVRVEPVGGTSFEILNTAQVTGYFVVPAKKMAYDQPPEVAGANAASYTVNSSPCGGAATLSGTSSCRKLGTEQINGRLAEKWQVDRTVDGKHVVLTVWIDPALRTMVKSRSDHGTYELVNIRIGAQPASLFEVPAGYSHKEMGSISFTRAK